MKSRLVVGGCLYFLFFREDDVRCVICSTAFGWILCYLTFILPSLDLLKLPYSPVMIKIPRPFMGLP
jgi:hypothetical protein